MVNCCKISFLKKTAFYIETWKIECGVCHVVTCWYGDTLDELQDIDTINRVISKGKAVNFSAESKPGCITMYGEQDLTINIVSFNKERVEIQKVLDIANKKKEKCNLQAWLNAFILF